MHRRGAIIGAACHLFTLSSSILRVRRFSIWNTILGSSLLTMPWGITMAGFFPGLVLILLMSGLCLYTAYRLLAAHAYHGKRNPFFVVQSTIVIMSQLINYRRWRRERRGAGPESNLSEQMGGIRR